MSGRGEVSGGFGTSEALRYIASVPWQFAKSMPKWPHWYTVREWNPDREAEFEAFVRLIREQGVVKPWPLRPSRDGRICPRCGMAHGWARHHNTYLTLDGWEYWTMGAPVAETTVINRAEPTAAA